jgi:hypothetical protein
MYSFIILFSICYYYRSVEKKVFVFPIFEKMFRNFVFSFAKNAGENTKIAKVPHMFSIKPLPFTEVLAKYKFFRPIVHFLTGYKNKSEGTGPQFLHLSFITCTKTLKYRYDSMPFVDTIDYI